VDVVRLEDRSELVREARSLLEEYLRLPDGWRGEVPPVLPEGLAADIREFPGPAAPPLGAALVALADRGLVGMVCVVHHDKSSARLERMFVRPDWRGNGIGRVLLETALDVANQLGYRHVVLDVLMERLEAIGLYSSAGFMPMEAYADYGREMRFMIRAVS
jgi:GNAT superfamily N-acetyltransferase